MSQGDNKLTILLLNQAWLAPELRSLGHTVITAGWVNESFDVVFRRGEQIQTVLTRVSAIASPNCAVYFDDSTTITLCGLDTLQIPCLFYSVDTHHHASWHAAFSAMFSKTLVAQPDYLSRFSPYTNGLDWLPLWAPRKTRPAEKKDIDVCFRGTLERSLHPKRADFFDTLRGLIDIDAQKGPYYEAYPRAKIVVNQTVCSDLNFRVFEALESNALLITPRIQNGLPQLFEAGKDYIEYEEGNAEELAALCQKFLADEQARAAIAHSGHQKVMQKHTALARATDLASHLESLTLQANPQKYTGASNTYLYAALNGVLSRDNLEEVSENAIERVYLQEAVRCILLSFEVGESFENLAEVCVLNIMLLCKKLSCESIGLAMLREAIGYQPEKVLLRLMEIEALTDLGLKEQAQSRAREISEAPDELLDYAIDTVAKAHASVWATMQQQRN